MKRTDVLLDPATPDDSWSHDLWDDADTTDVAVVDRAPRRFSWLKWIVYVIGTLAIVAILVGGAVGWWYIRQVNPSGEGRVTQNFTVNEADTLETVSVRLQDEGFITNARVFRFYVNHKGKLDLTPGYYALPPRAHMGNIMRVLNTPPAATYRKVTFPEGFSVAKMARRVERDLPPLTASSFEAAATSGEVRSLFQPEGSTSLEGLLFPDTYQVAGNESEAQIVNRMVHLMERVGRQESIDTKSQELGLSTYQILVVASMIEREARFDVDRAKIARVIYNRLFFQMPLQIDATLYYGQPQDTPFSALKDLDTPYNTYLHAGLPPTPIANPGRASIQAALNPAPNPALGDPICRDLASDQACVYLFYVVSDEEGHHVFAATLAQHEANVEAARAAGFL